MTEQTFRKLNNFLKAYNLRYVAFYDLYMIYDYYRIYNKSISPTMILKLNEYKMAGNSFKALYNRLAILIDKGLLVNVSTGKGYLLIPTNKAIRELSKL